MSPPGPISGNSPNPAGYVVTNNTSTQTVVQTNVVVQTATGGGGITDGGGFDGSLIPSSANGNDWLPAGLPPDVASELQALVDGMSEIKTEISSIGDVNCPVGNSVQTGALLNSLMAMMPKLGQLLQSADPAVQGKALQVLDALTAAMQEAHGNMSQSDLGATVADLTAALQEPIGWLRDQPDLGATNVNLTTISTSVSVSTSTTTTFVYNGGGNGPGGFEDCVARGANGCKFPVSTDPMLVVQWVLRESYLETTLELRDYADKVKFYNDLKHKIREELKLRRNELSAYAGQEGDTPLDNPFTPETIDDKYYGTATMGDTEGMTAEQKAALEATNQAKQDKSDATAAYAAFQKSLDDAPVTKSITPPPAPPGFSGAGDSRGTAIDNYGDELVKWYTSLSPEQKEWVKEQLKSGALSFTLNSREDDNCGDDNHRVNYKPPFTVDSEKITDKAIEAWLQEAGTDTAEKLRTQDTNGSKSYNLHEIQVGFNIPADCKVKDADSMPWPPEGYTVNTEKYPTAASVKEADGSKDGEWSAGNPVETKSDLEAYNKQLEEQLSSVGDDAQLANVDLQNCLQRQQQTLQLMSNISKTSHEMKTSVIRNIGG